MKIALLYFNPGIIKNPLDGGGKKWADIFSEE